MACNAVPVTDDYCLRNPEDILGRLATKPLSDILMFVFSPVITRSKYLFNTSLLSAILPGFIPPKACVITRASFSDSLAHLVLGGSLSATLSSLSQKYVPVSPCMADPLLCRVQCLSVARLGLLSAAFLSGLILLISCALQMGVFHAIVLTRALTGAFSLGLALSIPMQVLFLAAG